MKERSYELAKELSADGDEFFGVDFTPDRPDQKFWVWRGWGYHSHAACITPKEALESWQEHFLLSGANWLFPILSRFANGEAVDTDSVLAAYLAHHGRPAPQRSIG